MESSRIFIKGLPPNINEAEFRRHFSAVSLVKDAKIYPNRRIGFVGYEGPDEAQKAVKYFNRTFIRMSRLNVEIARSLPRAKEATPEKTTETPVKNSNKNAEHGQGKGLKRKRDGDRKDEDDPKLKEFLDVVRPKRTAISWEQEGFDTHVQLDPESQMEVAADAADSPNDEEYQDISKTAKDAKTVQEVALPGPVPESVEDEALENNGQAVDESTAISQPKQSAVSDSEWARSRTSRLLGLLDEDEEDAHRQPAPSAPDIVDTDADVEKGSALKRPSTAAERSFPTPSPEDAAENDQTQSTANEFRDDQPSMRLFVRNLPYDVTEEQLERDFGGFGNLEEVHVALDKKTGLGKGFAFLQFSNPDSAQNAMQEKDGQTFAGRLIHVLPASAKQDNKIDEFSLSKLPLKKQQQIKKRREATSNTFNWNALYMNTDAVISSVADRLGLSKSEVLDPRSSDAAIKQAHAETHVIQETKSYFEQHGVDLDSFKRKQRGDTTILVKNLPYDCSQDELKRRFEEHGELKKFLMPPSKTVAIVEFANAAQCQAAFSALAYRRLKSSMLFLEKAPKGLFDTQTPASSNKAISNADMKMTGADLKEADVAPAEASGRSTLYVRNLNFKTTTMQLIEAFENFDGFLSAVVKTKSDPKRPNEVLSMGFGFVEFRSSNQAQQATQIMDGHELDGHKLQIRSSHKGADAAEQRRLADVDRKAAAKSTKIIIKNLPFEATKKDVRNLFGAYGQLRSVRVPKKMDRAARGFAFADFLTPKEAENAMNALKHTHLLGRRLVLDFADEDAEDAEAEIERMQQKVGAQVNKVALSKLTGGGRKKFSTQNDEEEGN